MLWRVLGWYKEETEKPREGGKVSGEGKWLQSRACTEVLEKPLMRGGFSGEDSGHQHSGERKHENKRKDAEKKREKVVRKAQDVFSTEAPEGAWPGIIQRPSWKWGGED